MRQPGIASRDHQALTLGQLAACDQRVDRGLDLQRAAGRAARAKGQVAVGAHRPEGDRSVARELEHGATPVGDDLEHAAEVLVEEALRVLGVADVVINEALGEVGEAAQVGKEQGRGQGLSEGLPRSGQVAHETLA